MSDQQKLTRRDWFRLRKPASETNALGADQYPASQAALTPIEHPPNHDGMNLADLPPMREATLDANQVQALFSDIAQLGSEIMLMQRSDNARRASASQPNCTEKVELAKTALLSGTVNRVQIRYRWKDSLWIDTLSCQPDGYHIVRIAHQG